MPAINPVAQSFEIEAASPEAREPENESYVIRIQLHGTYEVRSFLSDSGVDEKRIALAIETLSQNRRVTVSNRLKGGQRLVA